MNSVLVSNKKNSNPKISNNVQKVVQLKLEYCTCLTWVLIGLLVGGLPLASVTTLYICRQSQTSMNQTSLSESIKFPYSCGGTSSYTRWQLYLTSALRMTIDTSSCNFNSTPTYFTSIAGTNVHFILDGYGAIYGPKKNSFSIFVRWIPGFSANQTLDYSQQFLWNVDWLGIIP